MEYKEGMGGLGVYLCTAEKRSFDELFTALSAEKFNVEKPESKRVDAAIAVVKAHFPAPFGDFRWPTGVNFRGLRSEYAGLGELSEVHVPGKYSFSGGRRCTGLRLFSDPLRAQNSFYFITAVFENSERPGAYVPGCVDDLVRDDPEPVDRYPCRGISRLPTREGFTAEFGVPNIFDFPTLAVRYARAMKVTLQAEKITGLNRSEIDYLRSQMTSTD